MADNGGARRRTGRRWLWAVAGLAGVGAVCSVVGIWHLPDRMYPGTYAEVGEARAALQAGLLTAAAALTAVAGGLIALDETRQANTETRRANVAADAREREANANTHVRELYATAIGLLGGETIDSRLGGIYALERVAVDSPADQRTVVEVLSAFIREHTQSPVVSTPSVRRPLPGRRWGSRTAQGDNLPATDVRAAMTVLGRIPDRPGIPRADLSHANLADIEISEGNFAGVRFVGANLVHSFLNGTNLVKASLYEADLSRAVLLDVDLAGARLIEANFSHARLVGTNLSGADLGFSAGDSTLSADLSSADLAGAEGLTQEQVDAARGNEATKLPQGLSRPASWISSDAGGS